MAAPAGGNGGAGDTGIAGANFPYAVLPSILKDLDVFELSRVRLVNKGFYEAASSQALWANFPLRFTRKLPGGGVDRSVVKRLTDAQFLELDQRAGSGRRTRTRVIDLAGCCKLTNASLEAILERIDKHASPPSKIDISRCRVTSAEFVHLLTRLDQKLEAPWDKSRTNLSFNNIKAIYAENLTYLSQFDLTRAGGQVAVYSHLCATCGAKADDLGLCGRCRRIELCRECKGVLCKRCKVNALCPQVCSRTGDHLERTHCRPCARAFRRQFLCSMCFGALGVVMIAIFLAIMVRVPS
ncbi:hypothetical protein KFL_005980070 [Klebsormidium nitens]|uniref:F-box domain-containing protein n=1 Tax=Klebsormidium nitens TaxID=105231 RepID=A0A1Y1IJ06_KLENI|nr:hypothetical protein KFL_005980070 [Klebsormidium nitens]|eukprot:GAQ90092.1 hypothetical protein KFL_005980070 [Klebsormidium nitens]